MAKINLLPWREKLREKQKKAFIESAGLACVVGVFVLIIWSAILGIQVDNQVARNDVLKSEIAKLDKEIEEVQSLEKKRDVLVSRMKIISGLQADRPQIVHIFDALVRSLPEGVYYKSITRSPGTIVINGIADSNESVSALMRKLEASDYFKSPLLTGVVNQKMTINGKDSKTQQNVSIFNLTVNEETPPAGTASPASTTSTQGSAK